MRLDRLYNMSAIRAARVARSALSYTQDFPAPDIIGGLAITFILLCERYGISPRAALETTDRVIRRFHELEPGNLRGLRRLLREELPDA